MHFVVALSRKGTSQWLVYWGGVNHKEEIDPRSVQLLPFIPSLPLSCLPSFLPSSLPASLIHALMFAATLAMGMDGHPPTVYFRTVVWFRLDFCSQNCTPSWVMVSPLPLSRVYFPYFSSISLLSLNLLPLLHMAARDGHMPPTLKSHYSTKKKEKRNLDDRICTFLQRHNYVKDSLSIFNLSRSSNYDQNDGHKHGNKSHP